MSLSNCRIDLRKVLEDFDTESLDALVQSNVDKEGMSQEEAEVAAVEQKLSELDTVESLVQGDILSQYKKLDPKGSAASSAPVTRLRQAPPVLPERSFPTGLSEAFEMAGQGSFRTIRDLKAALQETALASQKAEGLDLTEDSEGTEEYLTEMGVRDALHALKSNENAVGWYDVTVHKALNVLTLVHPEMATDPAARFAFKWALAVTSNGVVVDKNFQLAEVAYTTWKSTGKMPTDIGIGNALDKMNNSMRLFNALSEEMGYELLEKVMLSPFTVRQLDAAVDTVTGELKDTVVRGAAVLGPKVGNGFFSNLNGLFDQLTMDRWLMRTWGRWTGTLIEDKSSLAREKRTAIKKWVQEIKKDKKATAAFEKALGARLQTSRIDELALQIEKKSAKAANRDVFNQTEAGKQLRLKGNGLAKDLDGQKEAPSNGTERNQIRKVFNNVLDRLRSEEGLPDLTMSDLQALVWYPERLLYDAAKSEEEYEEGYEDDDAPDYANAAIKLAKARGIKNSKIKAATTAAEKDYEARHSAGSAKRGARVPSSKRQKTDELSAKERKGLLVSKVYTAGRARRETVTKARSFGVGGTAASRRSEGVTPHVPSKAFAKAMADAELPALTMNELPATPEAAARFRSAIEESKAAGKYGAAVYVYSQDEYQGMRLFQSVDGKAGFGIKSDGDIVSVYSDGGGKSYSMLELAVEQGGTKLDAFDVGLVEIYADAGFKPVKREPWDEGEIPKGWDKKTFARFNNGEPDVVYMEHTPGYLPDITGAPAQMPRTLKQSQPTPSISEEQDAVDALAEVLPAPVELGAPEAAIEEAKKQTGYQGRDLGEAYEWVRAYNKFGAAGMTLEARMERAKAMGFNTDARYYHGTGYLVRNFTLDYLNRDRPFIFVSANPDVAQNFAEASVDMRLDRAERERELELVLSGQKPGDAKVNAASEDASLGLDANANILQVLIREDNLYDFTTAGFEQVQRFEQGITEYYRYMVEAGSVSSEEAEYRAETDTEAMADGEWSIIEESPAIQAVLREQGYAGFTTLEMGALNTALFDPADIRSVNAAFDPAYGGTNSLLAQEVTSVVEETFPDANPRLLMHHKQVTKRIPELQAAAKGVKDKTVTREEYKALVEQYKPVTPYDSVPEPNSEEEMKKALKKDQVPVLGVPNRELEDGHPVGVRLDIPAYKNHGVWIAAIHEQVSGFKAGAVIGYESAALVNNATLGALEGLSLSIAAGKDKTTIAVIKGEFQAISPAEAKAMGDRALKDPAWTQVGYDPERHSYFYDRTTMEPVVGGDSVLQVGSLTLVKNAQYAPAEDFLYQDQEDRTDPRGDYNIDTGVIRLHEATDLSTFLHEFAHMALEQERRDARDYDMGNEHDALLKFLGMKSWEDLNEDRHELFADTFEDYLRTGKAPSIRLARAFAAFARWISDVYQNITAKRPGMLTPEVVDIFDRLLATEEAIAEAAGSPAFQELFRSKEQAGMTDAVFKAKEEAREKREDEARRGTYEKLLAEMKKRRSLEWKEEKAPIIEKEKKRLAKTPPYKARHLISKSRVDTALLKEALGLEELPSGIMWMHKNGGKDPSDYADKSGFGSVLEMVEATNAVESIGPQAALNAEDQMIERHGDLMNDGSLERIAVEEMHNEEEASRLLIVLKELSKKTRKASPDKKYVKAQAEALVGKMKWGEMKEDKYYRAEMEAYGNAIRAKDPEEKFDFQMSRLANHYMYRAILARKKRALTHREYALKAKKMKKPASTGTSPEANFRASAFAQMRMLAEAYDVGGKTPSTKTPMSETARKAAEKRTAKAQAFVNFINGQKAAGINVELFDSTLLDIENDGFLLPMFDELTMDQLEGVYDQLRHLRFVAGQFSKDAQDKLKEEHAPLIAQAQKTGTRKQTGGKWVDERKEKIKYGLQYGIHQLVSLRNMIRKLDGDLKNSGGAFYDSIVRRLSTAGDIQIETKEKFYAKFEEDFDVEEMYSLSNSSSSVEKVERGTDGYRGENNEHAGVDWELSARQRFMVAVYWGTESSREAIRRAFGVNDAEVQQMMETLTPVQLRQVQNVWDLNESMAPALFKAAAVRLGVAPPKLPAIPFIVNGVQLTGGHMQLIYGENSASVAAEARLDSDEVTTQNSVLPTLAHSAIARKGGGGRPVLLDTNNIFRAMDNSAHYIAYAEVAADINTVYNNPKVREAIRANHGRGFDKALFRNLQGVTVGKPEYDPSVVFAAMARILRNAKSATYLAYNVRNLAQQPVSAIQAIDEIGGAAYLAESERMMANAQNYIDFVDSKSAEMRDRKNFLNQQAADLMQKVVSGSQVEKYFHAWNRRGFAPHVWLDSLVAYPVWMATYNAEMSKSGDEQKATIDANAAVAESVGSGRDIHMGKMMRSTETWYIRLIAMFGSWFNSTTFQRAYRSLINDGKVHPWIALRSLMVTPIMMAIVSELVIGRLPDWEDEDDDFFLKAITQFYGAPLPIIGDVLNITSSFKPSGLFEGTTGDVRDFIKTGGGLLTDAPKTGYDVAHDFLEMASAFVPISGIGNILRPLDYADSVAKGEQDDWPPSDLFGFLGETYQALTLGGQAK